MRESPSIIPWGDLDRAVYLVLDDFGYKYGGCFWPETREGNTHRATLIRHCLRANIRRLSASWRSIPPRAGRAT
jgi:hypothetical protein